MANAVFALPGFTSRSVLTVCYRSLRMKGNCWYKKMFRTRLKIISTHMSLRKRILFSQTKRNLYLRSLSVIFEVIFNVDPHSWPGIRGFHFFLSQCSVSRRSAINRGPSIIQVISLHTIRRTINWSKHQKFGLLLTFLRYLCAFKMNRNIMRLCGFPNVKSDVCKFFLVWVKLKRSLAAYSPWFLCEHHVITISRKARRARKVERNNW